MMRRALASRAALGALVSDQPTHSPPPALHRAPLLRIQCRHLSSQAAQWISELRYGAGDGPVFGSFGSTFSDGALTTRQLYCKALVFASGGGRRSRDWIAGCSAMSIPNQTLLSIALQYVASEDDVVILREHLIGKLLQTGDANGDVGMDLRDPLAALHRPPTAPPSTARSPEQHPQPPSASVAFSSLCGESGKARVASGTSPPPHSALEEEDDDDETTKLLRKLARQLTSNDPEATEQQQQQQQQQSTSRSLTATGSASEAVEGKHGAGQSTTSASTSSAGPSAPSGSGLPSEESLPPSFTPEEIRAAEDCVLAASPEARCFVYDAMAASLFHCHGDVTVVEEARRRVFRLGATYFGLGDATLRPLWRTVEAELIVRKEKLRMLGRPWGE